MTVPNVLTVVRILLVPALVAALVQRTATGDLVAAAIFALASATDWVDGRLARARGEVSTFGEVMDPIADKLLVAAALVTLAALDRLAVWVVVVILGREALVTFARWRAEEVIPAAPWGKAKTAVQVVAIFLLVLLDPSPVWVDALVLAAVALTIASGVDFFRRSCYDSES